MIPLKKLTTEAYQADPEDGIVHFGTTEINFVLDAAAASSRKRCRILLHPGTDAKLHSMCVGYKAGTYIRPNRHRGKDESVTVLKGQCAVTFFDDKGRGKFVVSLSDRSVDSIYYLRIPAGVWHTLAVEQDGILLESTPGPLDPVDTEYAPWAPEEGDEEGIAKFRHERYAFLSKCGPARLSRTEKSVWVTKDADASLGTPEDEKLLELVRFEGYDRSRICTHQTTDDRLQEMLLAFSADSHVRPSRHAEDETLYVLAGTGTYCFFDDHGSMTKQVPLGPLGSGKACFCRVPAGRWHTLLLDGPMLVLQAAPGPFKKENTEYAPWEAK